MVSNLVVEISIFNLDPFSIRSIAKDPVYIEERNGTVLIRGAVVSSEIIHQGFGCKLEDSDSTSGPVTRPAVNEERCLQDHIPYTPGCMISRS